MEKGNNSDSKKTLSVKEAAPVWKRKENTLEDYYALPDDIRVELIDGTFYKMEAPSFVHQRLITALWKQIDSFIEKNGGKCVAAIAPLDVRLNRDNKTMVQPDVIVICNHDQITKKRLEGAPDFVAEIVSPSTASVDYVIKTAKYKEAGVREYWILDPEQKRLMIYDFSDNKAPRIQEIKGSADLNIYDGMLMINLDKFAEIIERGY